MGKTYTKSQAIHEAQERREEREAERFLQFMLSHADDVGCVSPHPEQCRCGDCLTYLAGEPKPEWYETDEFRDKLTRRLLCDPDVTSCDETEEILDDIIDLIRISIPGYSAR